MRLTFLLAVRSSAPKAQPRCGVYRDDGPGSALCARSETAYSPIRRVQM